MKKAGFPAGGETGHEPEPKEYVCGKASAKKRTLELNIDNFVQDFPSRSIHADFIANFQIGRAHV